MNKTKKGKIRWGLFVGIVLCISIFAGTIYVFNEIFPKAKAIQLPERGDIISVSLSCNTSDMIVTIREENYEKLLPYIGEAEPTRKQAMDDYPTVRLYYGISIQTTEREYRCFVYEENGEICVESPYEGIYRAQEPLLDLILTYYQAY